MRMVTWSYTSAPPAQAEQQENRQHTARRAKRDGDPRLHVGGGGRARSDEARTGRDRQRERPRCPADRVLERCRALDVDLQASSRACPRDPLDRLDERVRTHLELLHLVEKPLRVGARAYAREQVFGDEAAHYRERVELGIELRSGQLHLRERLTDERQRRGQADAMVAGDLGQPLHDRPELDLGQRLVPVLGQELADLLAESGEVELFGKLRSEQEQDLGEEGHVLLPEGEQEQQDALADVGRDLADHAEVEEVDRPVRPEQVPRVRVGVEEAVGEDLAVERLEQLTGGLLALRALGRLAHRPAGNQLEHEQALRREPMVDAGRVEPRERLQHLAHLIDVRRLLLEIELALERVRKVLDDCRQVDDPPERLPALGLLGEQAEQPEVAHDLVAGAGPLHLDDDALAALQRRLVHLADRASGERLGIDRGEDVLPGDAELFLHHLHDLGLRQRRDIVLERRELDDELGRQEIGTCREDLAQLRERRAKLLERVAEPAGADLDRIGAAARLAHAVLGEDRGDAGRAAEEAAFDLGLGHGSPPSRCVRTITTVQVASWETRLGTFSSRNSLRPLMPTLPITITSMSSAFARSTITRAGSFPCAASGRASGPTTCSVYSASSRCVSALFIPSRTDWQTTSSAS